MTQPYDTPPSQPAIPMTTAETTALGALLSSPPPKISEAALRAALAQHWGLEGNLRPMVSERDLNFRLDTPKARYLVKLTHNAEAESMSDFQTRALLHVAKRDPGLAVPGVVLPRDQDCAAKAEAPPLWANLPEGRLRLYRWLQGEPVFPHPRSLKLAHSSGTALGRLVLALKDFSHPAADYTLLWDIRQTPALASLAPMIPDPESRAQAIAFIQDFEARISPQLKDLPWQVCHNDFNLYNLLIDPQKPDEIAGVLDFGDMVYTPRICDLAVAAAYQIQPQRPVESISAFLAGYAQYVQPSPAEIALLFDLIIARMTTTLCITSWRATRYPENAAYILRNVPNARAGLAAFRALDAAEATAAFAQAIAAPDKVNLK